MTWQAQTSSTIDAQFVMLCLHNDTFLDSFWGGVTELALYISIVCTVNI